MEAFDGIQEVSGATDGQTTSTEGVASAIDERVEQADRIAAEVQAGATANDRQAERIQEINASVQRLGDA